MQRTDHIAIDEQLDGTYLMTCKRGGSVIFETYITYRLLRHVFFLLGERIAVAQNGPAVTEYHFYCGPDEDDYQTFEERVEGWLLHALEQIETEYEEGKE